MKYFKIDISGENYSIAEELNKLPYNFGATSNFEMLGETNPELVTGLAWANHPDVGFWSGVAENSIPDHDFTKKINEAKVLVPESGAVKVTYSLVDVPDSEISGKVSAWKDEIRATRDHYLQLTDFTQLADIPITSDIKEEYKVFRGELRDMFDGVPATGTGIAWPEMPTGAPNIHIDPLPPFPPLI